MKEILIINGSGGVGKDTFVGCLSRFKKVYHTSIVNPVKELAKQAGWDGGKTERDRKFLSDLKVLIDTYNDNNYKSMEKDMQDFKGNNLLLFTSEWCINWALQKNEGLALREFNRD